MRERERWQEDSLFKWFQIIYLQSEINSIWNWNPNDFYSMQFIDNKNADMDLIHCADDTGYTGWHLYVFIPFRIFSIACDTYRRRRLVNVINYSFHISLTGIRMCTFGHLGLSLRHTDQMIAIIYSICRWCVVLFLLTIHSIHTQISKESHFVCIGVNVIRQRCSQIVGVYSHKMLHTI